MNIEGLQGAIDVLRVTILQTLREDCRWCPDAPEKCLNERHRRLRAALDEARQ